MSEPRDSWTAVAAVTTKGKPSSSTPVSRGITMARSFSIAPIRSKVSAMRFGVARLQRIDEHGDAEAERGHAAARPS